MFENSRITNTIALSKYLNFRYDDLVVLCKKQEYNKIVSFSKNGKKRVFYTPNADLKFVQQNLNTWFRAQMREHWNASTSKNKALFQTESSCVNHARMHARQKHILQVDIQNFFGSISRQRVYDFFKENLTNKNLGASLTLLTTNNNMLPTGAPSSPALAEMIIHALDAKLIAYSRKNNLKYSRYVDDLCFSSKSYINIGILYEIESIVNSEKFRLNYAKTRFRSHKAKQTITGITVNDHPNVDRKYMRILRSIVHSIETKGLEKAFHIYTEKFPEKEVSDAIHFSNIIEGKLAWVAAVKGSKNTEYLRMKEVVEKSIFLNSTLSSNCVENTQYCLCYQAPNFVC